LNGHECGRCAAPQVWLTLFIAITLLPLCLGSDDGRIGVLYVGSVSRSPPYWFMRADPLFQVTFVPAEIRDFMAIGPMPAPTLSDLHRLIRLYMPRTYEDLVADYNVIVMFEANVQAVGRHAEKLARGVSEGGLGLQMSGGWQSFGAASSYQGWTQTPIAPLLPTEDVPGTWIEDLGQRLVIDRPDNELIKSIPWDTNDPALHGAVWDHNLLVVRLGAEMLAHVVTGSGREDPMMVTWRLPNGPRTFSFASEGGWRLFSMTKWKYNYDFCANLVIYLADRPVPQDLELVRAARSKIFEFSTRRIVLLSLLEFCESFGANTARLYHRLEDADRLAKSAVPEYVKLHFEQVLETYKKANAMMDRLEQDAVELKKRALFWVYLIEWLSVTATSLLGGAALWWLMVRRRLYREVGTTRAG